MSKANLIFFLMIGLSQPVAGGKKDLKHGVVFIAGKPAYVDNLNLPNGIWIAPLDYLDKVKTPTIDNGFISWSDTDVTVSRIAITDLRSVDEWKKSYWYKIDQNVGFVSVDRKIWEPLRIAIIQERPKRRPRNGKFLMRIRLECKFFSGVFDVIEEDDNHIR